MPEKKQYPSKFLDFWRCQGRNRISTYYSTTAPKLPYPATTTYIALSHFLNGRLTPVVIFLGRRHADVTKFSSCARRIEGGNVFT